METKQQGRGGVVHRFWQHRIVELFDDAGWPAKPELFDADVYVNMGDTELVIEVAMGINDREVEHVERHLDTGFDVIWVVCRTAEVRTGLRQRLEENDLLADRVDLRLLQDIRNAETAPL